MNYKKLAVYAAAVASCAGLLGASFASAHGFGFFGNTLAPDQIAQHQQTMFQNEANLLGVSVDDVKSGWAQGKSQAQIAQDHGITADQLRQKMQDARTAAMKSQIQTLVDKGVITQAQADARLQFLANQKSGMGNGRQGRGFRF
jgi:hypothetical protein